MCFFVVRLFNPEERNEKVELLDNSKADIGICGLDFEVRQMNYEIKINQKSE